MFVFFLFVCRCSIQNCVICSHVRIEDGANLKDCYIGANYTVIKDGKWCVHVYDTFTRITHTYTYTHTVS